MQLGRLQRCSGRKDCWSEPNAQDVLGPEETRQASKTVRTLQHRPLAAITLSDRSVLRLLQHPASRCCDKEVYCTRSNKTDSCPTEHPPDGLKSRSRMRSVCHLRPQVFAARFPVSRDPPMFKHRCMPHQGHTNAAHRRLRADTRSTRDLQTGGMMQDFRPSAPTRVTRRRNPPRHDVRLEPFARADARRKLVPFDDKSVLHQYICKIN